MATLNPTAVKKTMDDLTNQDTLASIMKRYSEIERLSSSGPLEGESIELAAAILNDPEGSKLVEWFADGRDMIEPAAAVLGSLITAVRMSAAQPTNGAHKNFSEHYESGMRCFQNPTEVRSANILPWPTPPAA